MANKKKQKSANKLPVSKVDINELLESRDGGQIALRGYSYQFLYSCDLILSSGTDTIFTLEGIEDIDTIKCSDGNKTITHIQLKFSTQQQDASFMDSVLKNYLEAYLIDKNRYFKLVYDFSVAAGNLSKLFSRNLDKNSKEFWKTKVDNIKKGTSLWNWNNFNFEDFIQRISFENIKKDSLEKSIEDSLIENFGINTDNISLFANGIKLLCFDKMESRSEISHQEITQRIEEIKFDISSIYDAVLPKSSYRDNTFLCYPILLKNFDPTNEEMMNAFLIASISFANSPYDYLLLLLTNNAGEVIPNAIKFPKKAFQYIYNAINLGVEEEMDPLASPYPIEVTEKMLECFDGEYILQKQEPANIGLCRIADIGEEL